MKRLLWLIPILLCSQAWASWTLVQHPQNTTCPNTTQCSVTLIQPILPGDVVIVVGLPNLPSLTAISSVTPGGSFTHCVNCNQFDNTLNGSVDAAYTLNSMATAGPVVVTWSQAVNSGTVEVLEYSHTNPVVNFDSSGSRQVASAQTNFPGTPLALTGANDVIVQAIGASGTVSGITAPYSSPADFSVNAGVAGAINTASGTAPTWTNTSSNGVVMGLAVMEGAPAPAGTVPPPVQHTFIPLGGVNEQTQSYLVMTNDIGKLISMNCPATCTTTLPMVAPYNQWTVFIENLSASNLTVSGNGLDVDNSFSNVTLAQNQGLYVTSDGSEYFTERGMGSGGGGGGNLSGTLTPGKVPVATGVNTLGNGSMTDDGAGHVAILVAGSSLITGNSTLDDGAGNLSAGGRICANLVGANGVPCWYQDIGSPAGVITAQVGSFYSQLDAGGAPALWMKVSGVGASGWVQVAPIASPNFTGVPTAPTAAPGTNTTQLATTAFVLANAGTFSGGKFLPYSIYASQTSLNNTGTTDVIVLVPFSLPAASFSRIVVDVAINDVVAGHKYDVGIYTKAGVLKANLGAITWSPTGALDAAFLQGTVTFPAGEYLLAFTGTTGGSGSTTGAIQVNNQAGLYFNYTTASTSTAGVLPGSITVVESAAATGFGAPPYTPVMILY